MKNTNFLIGRGELLTGTIKAPGRYGKKAEAYTLLEAIARLTPQVAATIKELDSLPQITCPHDLAVVQLTLNPSFIAKSYFPSELLRSAGLISIGSKSVKITPEKWTKKASPSECSTTSLFVAGKRSTFRNFETFIKQIEWDSTEASNLSRIERFQSLTTEDRIKGVCDEDTRWFEVGLHMLPDENSTFIQEAFREYSEKEEVKIYSEVSFTAGNLWFVPVEGSFRAVKRLAEFSFVRVMRPVPKLRAFRPLQRGAGATLKCSLPTEQPLSSKPRVAILDGGLPVSHVLEPWLGSYKVLDPDADDDPGGIEHGLAVTSAFLFGPILPSINPARPFSFVDHLRVLDKETGGEDPLELYRTLGQVEQVLLSRQYEFINLSLGPDLPVEDTEVHAWTSVIDDLLRDGETFMTIAVGNNGDLDRASGNARVQVPSDCVNAISVGSANSTDKNWSRASYSAIGPGRSPGVIKPDLMAFGGDASEYFHVISPGNKPVLMPQMGTSFAAPYLLRTAVGIRSILGEDLMSLSTLKEPPMIGLMEPLKVAHFPCWTG